MRPPALTHPSAAVFLGDCLDVLAEMPDDSVDAIVCDPPYGLGFMGKAWDDLPPGLDWAVECLRVLKPGGHLLAFGGTRTWHRLAVAVEDAGFEVRDSIAWLYGSGFPKSLDVSKAIDKKRDEKYEAERREIILTVTTWIAENRDRAGISNRDIDAAFGFAGMAGHWTSSKSQPSVPTAEQWPGLLNLLGVDQPPPHVRDAVDAWLRIKGQPCPTWDEREVLSERVIEVKGGNGGWSDMVVSGRFKPGEKVIRETAPATPAAQQWAGWGTALKPAFEPIVVARKPLVGTVAANVLAHGTGALNIDGTRVEMSDADRSKIDNMGGFGREGWTRPDGTLGHVYEGTADGSLASTNAKAHDGGRWPANVLLDGDAAAELDGQSGAVGAHGRDRGTPTAGTLGWRGKPGESPRDDSGGASRFFPVFGDEPGGPCHTHHDIAPGGGDGPPRRIGFAGNDTWEECYAGSSQAPPALPTFRYQAKAPTRERPTVVAEDGTKTAHPTVKPLALMRWLVRLVTPPGGTVLDTFTGSGATIEAAIEEGFYALGIEREADYLPLIQVRLDRVKAPESAA